MVYLSCALVILGGFGFAGWVLYLRDRRSRRFNIEQAVTDMRAEFSALSGMNEVMRGAVGGLVESRASDQRGNLEMADAIGARLKATEERLGKCELALNIRKLGG